MKLIRDEDVGVFIVEYVGSYALGTLSVSQNGHLLTLTSNALSQTILGDIHYTELEDSNGDPFASASIALTYIQTAIADIGAPITYAGGDGTRISHVTVSEWAALEVGDTWDPNTYYFVTADP